MKQFMNVMLMNFRKILLPIMILACLTVVVQVVVYTLGLTQNDAYAAYAGLGYEAYRGSVICTEPVCFMTDLQTDRWNTVGLVSLIIAILFTVFIGKDSEQNISIIRNLPVKRVVLWLAKLVAVVLPLALVYCANYTAMFAQYLIYQNKVIDKFREVFVFYWNNGMTRTFFIELGVLIVIAVVISVFYSVKNYSIKNAKKGGTSNE